MKRRNFRLLIISFLNLAFVLAAIMGIGFRGHGGTIVFTDLRRLKGTYVFWSKLLMFVGLVLLFCALALVIITCLMSLFSKNRKLIKTILVIHQIIIVTMALGVVSVLTGENIFMVRFYQLTGRGKQYFDLWNPPWTFAIYTFNLLNLCLVGYSFSNF